MKTLLLVTNYNKNKESEGLLRNGGFPFHY